MTTGCSKECEEYSNICDFCYYYDFNGNKDGAYIDLGYCRLHKASREPSESCPKFICTNVKEKEEIRK